jgi:uncharacterized protein (TIGR03435 family)
VKLSVLALALAGAAFAQQASPAALQTQPTGAARGNHGPTFEVASIKLSPPNDDPGMGRGAKMALDMLQNQLPPGFIQMDRARVAMRNQSLLNLVAAAYRVRVSHVSGPAWMSEQQFDVDAKIPEDAPPGQVNEMLQALLAERFGLRLHSESRSQPGYALMVGKNGPRLDVSISPANPPNIAGADDAQKETALKTMKQTQAEMMKDMPGRGTAGWRFSRFRGITTARLAAALSSYVDGPVTDMTGLDGKYDVALETSQPYVDPASGMEDPGVTIFECVAKLGLKLEPRKVLVDTLVIDNLSKMPTED